MAVPNQGKRLLASTIDHIAATNTGRPWVSMPRDNSDLSKGFVDITFGQFANAINHAATWLDLNIGHADDDFDVFAYDGPPDIRPAIIAVAAVKVGRQILFPSPLIPASAKGRLVDVTGCKAFVYAETSKKAIQDILETRPHVHGVLAPPLQAWLTEKKAEIYEYPKSWEEAADDPWIIFHTSGTTGFPKPVIYTNRMMTTFDVAGTLPDASQNTLFSYIANQRVYPGVPMNHLVGMISGPATSRTTDQVIQYGNLGGLTVPPYLIRELCKSPEVLQRIRSLKFIHWAGGPLDKTTGDLLKGYVKLSPAFGSTEVGPYLTLQTEDPNDWAYYQFREGQGIQFVTRGQGLFELVLRKKENVSWQQIFLLHPDLSEYHTQDLFEKHPTKEDLWLYSGRSDDLVILANGNRLLAARMEVALMRDPRIQAALVGGSARDRPFLLVEPSDMVTASNQTKDGILSEIWPVVEVVNATSSSFANLQKHLTIVVNKSRPFLQSGKGSLMRRETIASYSKEIDEIYIDCV